MKSKKNNLKKKSKKNNLKKKTKNNKLSGGAEEWRNQRRGSAEPPPRSSRKRGRENNYKSSAQRIKNHRSEISLNTALSNIIKKIADASESHLIPSEVNYNEGDKLLNFYGNLGDRLKELKKFKENFNKSITTFGNSKIISKNSSDTNSVSKSSGHIPIQYTDDFLVNSLDFLHTNVLELNELYNSLTKYELSFIEPETKKVFYTLIEEVLELVELFDNFGNSNRGFLHLNNNNENLLKKSKIKIKQLFETQFINNFEKFRKHLKEFRESWSRQIPITNSPNRGSLEEDMIKNVSQLKKNILYLFKLAEIIENGSQLNLHDYDENLINKEDFSVFLKLINTNPKISIPIEDRSSESKQYNVAKCLINYVLMSYDISMDVELHPKYGFYRYDETFEMKAPHLYKENIFIKNVYLEYKVILIHIFNIYLNLLEKNSYNFSGETSHLDSLRFDKFYEFLRNTYSKINDKKIFFKNRNLFIEKMYILSKKILNIIYLDENFTTIRDDNNFVNFLNKLDFEKKNKILDRLKMIYYNFLRRRHRPRLEVLSPQIPPNQPNGQQPALFIL